MSKFSEMDAASDAVAALTTEQWDAATAAGPILVLAGAGTGKTKTLTAAVAHRIQERRIPAARILAVTFTNKAAGEMTQRIRAVLGDGPAPHWVGTFHGLAARQLREEPETAGLRPGFEILDADDSRRLVKRTMKAMNLGGEGDDDVATAGRDPVKAMSNRLAKFKDSLIVPGEVHDRVAGMIAEAERTGVAIDAAGLRAAARIYVEYQKRLQEANSADFGDLLLWPARALQEDEAYRLRWAGRWDAVLGDEYQDVNFAQYIWLKLLSVDHREIMVVGDDDQAVYSFRGSDVSFIRRFTQDFREAKVFRLEENFRSTAHIVGAATAVIARDPQRLGKTLFTRKDAGDRVEIVAFQDADGEADGIVAEMKRRHSADGLPWADMAVLYRSNHLSRTIEEALLRARIPYTLVGDVGFYARAEIKDALALLRLATHPDDLQSDESLRRVINMPARGLGPKAVSVLEEEAAWRQVPLMTAIETAELPPRARSAALGFVDVIRRVSRDREATLADQISLLLDGTGYRAMLRESRAETSEGRLENVQELILLAGQFHTARELLDHAALATSSPGEDDVGRVKLMTLHKGKGLEFAHVFLPAWEGNAFPPSYGDQAEERRLAYVALTRGMRRVTISHCRYRRGVAEPSVFIEDIPDEHRHLGWLAAGSSERAASSRVGPAMLEPMANPARTLARRAARRARPYLEPTEI